MLGTRRLHGIKISLLFCADIPEGRPLIDVLQSIASEKHFWTYQNEVILCREEASVEISRLLYKLTNGHISYTLYNISKCINF
ncbi:hypothetical protein L798_10858 [Zootermopsis nevadensis]|uniref:Uncharacterized protein n=2 Tax=Zootermopsis nevadensis TaxID=136037 RepID=A0A067QXH8_ZOONE|nr:hypothetical protein L798_10858 [Zootermopsis nevadensis]